MALVRQAITDAMAFAEPGTLAYRTLEKGAIAASRIVSRFEEAKVTPVKRKRVKQELDVDEALFGGFGAPFRPDGSRREPGPSTPSSFPIVAGRHPTLTLNLRQPSTAGRLPARHTRSVSRALDRDRLLTPCPVPVLPVSAPALPTPDTACPSNAVAGPSTAPLEMEDVEMGDAAVRRDDEEGETELDNLSELTLLPEDQPRRTRAQAKGKGKGKGKGKV
ncbi:MAG: hypothetical protein Q9228_007537 [Teloschistes exilis]